MGLAGGLLQVRQNLGPGDVDVEVLDVDVYLLHRLGRRLRGPGLGRPAPGSTSPASAAMPAAVGRTYTCRSSASSTSAPPGYRGAPVDRDAAGPGQGLDLRVRLHVRQDQDRDHEGPVPELLLDQVMDGHGGVPRPGDRRFLPDLAPVRDQVPLAVDDDVPASLDLNAEGPNVQEPDCEVQLGSRAEGFDLVQGQPVEVGGLQGLKGPPDGEGDAPPIQSEKFMYALSSITTTVYLAGWFS